jgi:hypothetical protein
MCQHWLLARNKALVVKEEPHTRRGTKQRRQKQSRNDTELLPKEKGIKFPRFSEREYVPSMLVITPPSERTAREGWISERCPENKNTPAPPREGGGVSPFLRGIIKTILCEGKDDASEAVHMRQHFTRDLRPCVKRPWPCKGRIQPGMLALSCIRCRCVCLRHPRHLTRLEDNIGKKKKKLV